MYNSVIPSGDSKKDKGTEKGKKKGEGKAINPKVQKPGSFTDFISQLKGLKQNE